LAVIAEAEFLDVIGTKAIRVFLLVIHSHRILTPFLRKSGLKLVCNVNIVCGNQNWTFMNLDSGIPSVLHMKEYKRRTSCFSAIVFGSTPNPLLANIDKHRPALQSIVRIRERESSCIQDPVVSAVVMGEGRTQIRRQQKRVDLLDYYFPLQSQYMLFCDLTILIIT
jgi:hypothetical protein